MNDAVTYNLLMAPLVAGAIALVRRFDSLPALVVALAVPEAVAVSLAVYYGEGGFKVAALLAWGIFLHAVVLSAGLAWVLRRRHKETACFLAAAGVLLVVVAIDAFLIEPHWLEVTRHRIPAAIPRATRIVVMADIQTDAVGRYEKSVFRTVLDLEPDLILLAGDYLHISSSEQRREAQDQLRRYLHAIRFGAPLGVFAVEGNTDSGDWATIFQGLPVTVVTSTQTFDVGSFQVTGLGVHDSFNQDFRLAAGSKYHVVVGHSPDFALGEVSADLLVAGHTHGGQVRVPFYGPVVTLSQVPRDWAAGLSQLDGGRTLLVSRGIGMERGDAPRLRFMCRPEIVVVDLYPAGEEMVGGDGSRRRAGEYAG